jgi:predicted aldo/keto reductase-like oxidoreductase
MNRRDFFKNTLAGATMIRTFPAVLSASARIQHPSGLERRSLGRTGEKLSMIGFGGIVVMNATSGEAAERVGQAIEAGVNYFDVAPSYGNAQDMLGPALEPYRKDVFLACKTLERDRDNSAGELNQSLKKMATDHFDLYQFHAVAKLAEVDKITGPKGALETFVAAQKAGKIRFIGFSAHSEEAALALMDRFDFDTILFPVNFATWHTGNFGPKVLARAQEKKMGILALKAMAKGVWPEGADRKSRPKCWYQPLEAPSDALMGLRFTLSHPVTAAIPPGDENLFRMALGLARNFTPLTPREAEEIKERAAGANPIFRYPQPA